MVTVEAGQVGKVLKHVVDILNDKMSHVCLVSSYLKIFTLIQVNRFRAFLQTFIKFNNLSPNGSDFQYVKHPLPIGLQVDVIQVSIRVYLLIQHCITYPSNQVIVAQYQRNVSPLYQALLLRPCLHEGKVTLLVGTSQQYGQNIIGVYMYQGNPPRGDKSTARVTLPLRGR